MTLRVYTVINLWRGWRLTERGARKLVWGTFGWVQLEPSLSYRASYSKAWFGYRVVLEQEIPKS